MIKKVVLSVVISGFFAMPLVAEDFSQYSNDELKAMKTEARSWDQEKKDDFRSEMQSRMQSMSQEERQAMKGSGGGQGSGNMNRMQKRDGSGSGQGRY